MATLATAVYRDNSWTNSGKDAIGSTSNAQINTYTSGFEFCEGSLAGLTINFGYPSVWYPIYAWGNVSSLIAYQPEVYPQPCVGSGATHTLSGNAKIGSTPLTYQPIDVYYKPNGFLAAQTRTDGSGNWSVSNLLNIAGAYYAICRDDNNTTYNGQIYDNLTAA